MQAFQVLTHESSPEVVETIEPSPGRGEVLLEIFACGLNFADLLMAKGTYQETPPVPFTLGLEVCGRVLAQGEGVSFPPIGARVALVGGSGGLAERGVFPASACRLVPDAMPDEVAAGFQIAYGTSHLALTRRAQLRPGERLVVLGAAGGVGLTAVEVGKALGAEVIAVARGADKLAIAKATGADHLIDAGADLTAEIKALGGADVVYDPVGGAAFDAAFRACNREARILSIGFASGDVPKVPANILMVKNISVIGFYWGGYMKFAPDALLDSLSEVMEWYAKGRLRPHISHVLPLKQASEALALLADRKATGKVVVTP
jgi:NADPH2:quinone reductase